MQCHTVMKTVRCMEYRQQEFTCHKTCWDRVCEDRVINCVKYVPETCSREVCYTVCKPCWETKTRCYTVYKPCWETKTREVCYTVCKPCWETKTRCYTVYKPCWENHSKEVCYTVCKPVWETKTRCYTVCKPCWETKTKEICYTVCKPCWEERTRTYTVCKPCWETKTREICYNVMVPVKYTKTIQVPSGHWVTEEYEVPGPVIRKCVREPGTWTYDACGCKCCYTPGCCRVECVQCPPRKCCKKRWVSTCCEKEICCTKWVCEPRTKTCCYKVCHMVPETRGCRHSAWRHVRAPGSSPVSGKCR
jgi:hypothetical protein